MNISKLIETCLEKDSTSLARTYYWNSKDPQVVSQRQDLIKTFVALYLVKSKADKIVVEDFQFSVEEYKLPTLNWLTELLSFSHTVHFNEIAKSFGKTIEIKTNDTDFDKMKGKVLDPVSFTHAVNTVANFDDKWKNQSGVIAKIPYLLNQVPGFYCEMTIGTDSSTKMFKILNMDGTKFSETLACMIGFDIPTYHEFTMLKPVLSEDLIVTRFISGK